MKMAWRPTARRGSRRKIERETPGPIEWHLDFYRACWNPKSSSAIWGALRIYSTALHPKNTRSGSIPGFTWLRFLDNQTPLISSEEVSESLWLTPQIALEESASGKFPMMPPTIITLRTLAEHGSWQNLCAAFRLG